MFTRTVVGWVMLVAAVIAASTLAYALGGGRLEATLGIVLASICVVGLLGGVFLLSVATSSTSNIAAIAWSVPGLAALLPFVGAVLQRSLDSPLGLLGSLLGATALWSAAAGAVAPVTSLAATAFARRSRLRAHALLAALSWLGAVAFWGYASGLFPQDW